MPVKSVAVIESCMGHIQRGEKDVQEQGEEARRGGGDGPFGYTVQGLGEIVVFEHLLRHLLRLYLGSVCDFVYFPGRKRRGTR